MEQEHITAIGIDASKGKSMVAVRRTGAEVVLSILTKNGVQKKVTNSIQRARKKFIPHEKGCCHITEKRQHGDDHGKSQPPHSLACDGR